MGKTLIRVRIFDDWFGETIVVRRLQLSMYEEEVRDNVVDGRLLLTLTEEDLESEKILTRLRDLASGWG